MAQKTWVTAGAVPVTPQQVLFCKELEKIHLQSRYGAALQRFGWAENRSLLIAPSLRKAIDLDLSFSAKHNPIFLYTRFSVEGSIETVQGWAGNRDLDNQFRSSGMLLKKISFNSAHDGNIRFGFRIGQSQWILSSHYKAFGQAGSDTVVKALGNCTMKGRFGHFFNNNAANQFCPPAMLVELIEAMIFLHRQRRNPLPNFQEFKNC